MGRAVTIEGDAEDWGELFAGTFGGEGNERPCPDAAPDCPRCGRHDRVEAIAAGWFCNRCLGFLTNLGDNPCKGCSRKGSVNEWGECPACANDWNPSTESTPMAKPSLSKAVTPSPTGALTVPIARTIPSPTNPRKHFDQGELAELAESIRTYGVLQAILVRPAKGWTVEPGKASGKACFFVSNVARALMDDGWKTEAEATANLPLYELVAGERRFRACRIVGLKEIPASVRELSDLQVLEIQLVENLQRRDVHPIEEAAGYALLMKEHGYSAKKIAVKVAKSEAYIYGTLKLGNLPAAARDAFRAGKLSKNHCILIGRIPSDKLREKAAEKILAPKEWAYTQRPELKGEPLTYRDAKGLIENEFMCELKGSGFDRTSLTLLPEAGSCDACPKRTGNAREEFPDARADVCTDPECFRAKEAAHRKAAADKVANKGVRVLTGKEAKSALNGFSSKWQDLKETNYRDAKRRSYKQLVGEELKAETVAALDGRGQVHYLVPKDRVREVLGEESGVAGGGRSGTSFAKDEERRKRERELQDEIDVGILRRVFEDVRGQIGRAVGFNTPALATRLRAVIHAELEHRDDAMVELAMVVGIPVAVKQDEYGRVDAPEGLLDEVLDRPAAELVGLLVCLSVDEELRFGGIERARGKALAAAFGLDAKAIAAEAKAAVKARANGPPPLQLRKCRVCGCTAEDCWQCVEKLGHPCDWVGDQDLCTACVGEEATAAANGHANGHAKRRKKQGATA
jgi:ParB/RepB/Spo0J family partition protein